jgi:hypothetical protein
MQDGILLLGACDGGAGYALDITVQYAEGPAPFDKPLGAFQALAHYLADARRPSTAAARSYGKPWGATTIADGPARADDQTVRDADLPRRDCDGAADLRWCRLHRRVRHPAVLPAGESAAARLVRPRALEEMVAATVLDR